MNELSLCLRFQTLTTSAIEFCRGQVLEGLRPFTYLEKSAPVSSALVAMVAVMALSFICGPESMAKRELHVEEKALGLMLQLLVKALQVRGSRGLQRLYIGEFGIRRSDVTTVDMKDSRDGSFRSSHSTT